jgi:hypothetical protein
VKNIMMFSKRSTGVIFLIILVQYAAMINSAAAAYDAPSGIFANSRPLVPKDSAIALARKKGYYKDDEINTITLDTTNAQWVIVSEKHTLSRKRHVKAHNGVCVNCRKTNGCTLVTSRTLVLDTVDGKTIKEKKKKTYYPNYE